MVYAFWDRFEPRPPEHEITADLFDFSRWVARISGSIDEGDVVKVAERAGIHTQWTEVLRTPEERFARLPDFAYRPRYVTVEGLRMAYVEQGDGDPILCLHGEPTWSFLYRKMIPKLAAKGRVVVPDLIGFGRSDKPSRTNAYTYKSHARWLRRFVEALDLQTITLVCQDWGGLLGMRALAAMPQRFARLVAMNTGLPTGANPGAAFLEWRRFSQRVDALDMVRLMQMSLKRPAAKEVLEAYAAPFPDRRYQTGALVFPRLVPVRPDHPGALENRRVLEVLRTLDLPVLLPWADGDAVTEPSRGHLAKVFRNVQGTPTIANAGHFIQEDAGEEVAEVIVNWMSA
ncbi:MAG: alpha/beta fold hydrolase [Acidobacteria bacterium]|nr:alpha/beta fold hydrolase [Acidobacteriota bacterium]